VLTEDARPAFTISGAWVSPDELVLVDAPENRLVRVDTRGRRTGIQSKDVETTLRNAFEESFLPVSIRTAKGETWLELVGGRLAKLSSIDRVLATHDLWGTQLGHGAKLIAILGWTIAGDDLFGYGNFELSDKSIETGFFRISLDNKADAEILSSKPNGATTQLWYRLGLPFIASIGEAGYALKMDDGLSLVKSLPGEEGLGRVGRFTGALGSPPGLTPFETPDDFKTIMGKLSSSTTPMGLYGWDGKLYLLWRYQDSNRGDWKVTRINPKKPAKEAWEATVILPSHAAQLMLIPGPRHWALVEKGSVEGYMTQSTDSVIFVPASRITSGFADKQLLCDLRE
jgi:hypothetical protein